MITGHLMTDLEGPELTSLEKDLLQHPQVGGVILFDRNYESKKQVSQLTKHIRQIAPECMIAVDQEGGRVQRFRHDFTSLPAFEEYGQAYQQDPNKAINWAQQMAFTMAKELQSVGVNLSFSPVLDLDLGMNEIIGSRAFNADPSIVVSLAGAFIKGMHQARMPATGKHFPGHGSVTADSHVTLPVDQRTFEVIYQQDMQPFIQLNSSLDAIMPAHILYEAVDSQPTCFSSYWLQTILRTQLQYQGVIFSDDLSMEGAAGMANPVDRAITALEAGCDMILVCNNQDASIEVLDGIEDYRNTRSAARLDDFRAKCQPL